MSVIQETEFEIEDVLFKVEKLPAMKALEVFERLRTELQEVFTSDSVMNILLGAETNDQVGNSLMVAQIVDVLLRIPPNVIGMLRQELFQSVRFHAPHHPGAGHVVLAGREDEAFTEPLDVYEVIARCLAVNFGNSVRRSGSRWGKLLNNTGILQ